MLTRSIKISNVSMSNKTCWSSLRIRNQEKALPLFTESYQNNDDNNNKTDFKTPSGLVK